MQKLVAEVMGVLPPLSFAELRWKVEAKKILYILWQFTSILQAATWPAKLCLLPANIRLK